MLVIVVSCACATPASADESFQLAADLPHGAFRVRGAPNVIVSAGAGFDPKAPLQLVVYLHGYSGCLRVLMGRGEVRCKPGDPATHEGWELGRHHAQAHTNTLLIVPQLAYMKRDGDPGAFARPGDFSAFLEELLRGPLAERLGGPRSLKDVASIDVVAHSGGYRAALAVIERGGIVPPVLHGVILLDALYGETTSFARYVERYARVGLHFITVSLPHAKPERESRSLGLRLTRSLGAERVTTASAAQLTHAIGSHAIVIAEGTPPHRLVPATHMAEILASLHAAAPPH